MIVNDGSITMTYRELEFVKACCMLSPQSTEETLDKLIHLTKNGCNVDFKDYEETIANPAVLTEE